MKSTITKFCIILVTVFTFMSCSNEPVDSALNTNPTNTGGTGGTGGGGTTTGIFTANFSGQTFNATNYQANIYNGEIQLVGSVGTQGQGFAFSLNGATAGTYSSTANLLAYVPANSTGDSYIALDPANPTTAVGNVIVSSINTVNHTISGTFSFIGYWSDWSVTNVAPITFTNGVFTNIPYTTTNPSTDTFYAKVDGVEFVEDTIDVSEVIASGFPDAYSIVASKSNGDTVGVWIAQSLGVGTYQLTGPFGLQVNSTALKSSLLYTGQTGSVTITSKTATHIEGTFNIVSNNFTSGQNITISQGAFSVDLP